jgi:hypothetical protein
MTETAGLFLLILILFLLIKALSFSLCLGHDPRDGVDGLFASRHDRFRVSARLCHGLWLWAEENDHGSKEAAAL